MINSTIDKIIQDFCERRSLNSIFSEQGQVHPAFPYCEIDVLSINDISGLQAQDLGKVADVRFQIYTSDDSAMEKANNLVDKLKDYSEIAQMKPLVFVAQISSVFKANRREGAKIVPGAFVDCRFSYTIGEVEPISVARVSGEIMDVNFDVILEEIEEPETEE